MSSEAPCSYLFVPGHRPERFDKAWRTDADCIVLDLEDAVDPADKPAARESIGLWLQTAALRSARTQEQAKERPRSLMQCLVRINDAQHEAHVDDLAWLQRARPAAVMLPKCESAAQVQALRAAMPFELAVLPLIETARGVLAASEIARSAGVLRLAFGSLDFALDMNLPADSLAADGASVALALASRAAGLPAPAAGVTPQIDTQRLQADWQRERSLGFGAKLCIHPLQITALHAALAPTAAEFGWAQRLLKAVHTSDAPALQFEGRMVDKPVILQARRIAALAERYPPSSP